jgi:hypothetical protein
MSEDWVMLVSGEEGTEPSRSVPASWERSLGEMVTFHVVACGRRESKGG